MDKSGRAYGFVMKALLTEEALDAAGRTISTDKSYDEETIANLVAVDALDQHHVLNAKNMAVVYTAIAAFENSVRELISKTLLEEVGESWWTDCVSKKIREAAKLRMDEEEKVRWHVQRGEDPIQFTMLPNLLNIIRQNPVQFEPFIHNSEWAASIFDTIERSRNVIMHSGKLSDRDVARLGSLIRDWTNQVSV